MGHMRSEMVGMPSRKCQWARNTSYYGLQVVHCVRRSHQYRISSKMTKYTLRAVACSSPFIPARLCWFTLVSPLLCSPALICACLRSFAGPCLSLIRARLCFGLPSLSFVSISNIWLVDNEHTHHIMSYQPV